MKGYNIKWTGEHGFVWFLGPVGMNNIRMPSRRQRDADFIRREDMGTAMLDALDIMEITGLERLTLTVVRANTG